MISNWEKFKKEKKIWTGKYDEIPDDYCYTESEDLNKASFEELIKSLNKINATDWEIEILTNEDLEYGGCFLKSVTINKIKFFVNLEGDTDQLADAEIGIWAELTFNQEAKNDPS